MISKSRMFQRHKGLNRNKSWIRDKVGLFILPLESIFIKAPFHLPTIKGCQIHTNSNICTARLHKVGTSNIPSHILQVSTTLPQGVCLSIVIKASYILVLHNRRCRWLQLWSLDFFHLRVELESSDASMNASNVNVCAHLLVCMPAPHGDATKMSTYVSSGNSPITRSIHTQ